MTTARFVHSPSPCPLVGNLRRALCTPCLRLLGRLALVAFGCWPGLLKVRGAPDPEAAVWVGAPHTGIVDPYLFLALGVPRPVMIASYAKIPVIGDVLRATGALLVPIASSRTTSSGGNAAVEEEDSLRRKAATAIAAAAVVESDTAVGSAGTKPKAASAAIRDAIIYSKRKYVAAFALAKGGKEAMAVDADLAKAVRADPLARVPLCVFPEGITHAGNSILPFFSGAFEGPAKVQPVLVRMPFRYFNSAAFLSSLGTHIRRLFASPYLRVEVDFLDSYQPSSAESPTPDFTASCVREKMAAASGLPLSPISARELRAEIKAAAQRKRKLVAYRAVCMH